MIDFLVRIAFQALPTLSIQPYLTLNVRKSAIINFLSLKTLFSFFNIVPLIIFFPFCFTEISRTSGVVSAITIAVCIALLALFNNYFTQWLKRQGGSREWILVSGVIVVLSLVGLDYLKIISVMNFSGSVLSRVASQPWLAFIFASIAATAYGVNNKNLYSNLYIEELSVREKEKTSTDYPFFHRFGRVGDLAASELKLILRHKRSKSALVMSSIFLFYGLIFYTNDKLSQNQFQIPMIAAVMIIGKAFSMVKS